MASEMVREKPVQTSPEWEALCTGGSRFTGGGKNRGNFTNQDTMGSGKVHIFHSGTPLTWTLLGHKSKCPD